MAKNKGIIDLSTGYPQVAIYKKMIYDIRY